MKPTLLLSFICLGVAGIMPRAFAAERQFMPLMRERMPALQSVQPPPAFALPRRSEPRELRPLLPQAAEETVLPRVDSAGKKRLPDEAQARTLIALFAAEEKPLRD